MKALYALAVAALACVVATRAAESPGGFVIGASDVRASNQQTDRSPLTFDCSDQPLVASFTWAKRQAMACVFDDDPVGPWYEAAEPGREAFCMRDTAHQAMGAYALGLAKHNHNMLLRFAAAVSDARDWCSLWEIDRYNRPAPVDFKDDAAFWYNLPANFDVLDCCYRMYLWSGDLSYVNDPVFLNFYQHTVTDYVTRWGLQIDEAMNRPRLLNTRGILDPHAKFQISRGIPGYDEQTKGYTLGIDVLATQYAAYLSFAHIQEVRGDADLAATYHAKADAVKRLLDEKWWNETSHSYFARVDENHRPAGQAGSVLLDRGCVDDPQRIRGSLAAGRVSVEAEYAYGDADTAYAKMIDIAQGTHSRREYPEVPFSWIGALVNGTMGITLQATSALQAWTQGFWVQAVVRTFPGLGSKVAWAELQHLPIRANEVSVRHDGLRKTTFTNLRGPALIWQSCLPGSHETLLVNGQPVQAHTESDAVGRPFSWVRIAVGPGGTSTVEAAP